MIWIELWAAWCAMFYHGIELPHAKPECKIIPFPKKRRR